MLDTDYQRRVVNKFRKGVSILKPGIYKHFKGKYYRVLGVSRNSENEHEERVVYESLYEHEKYGFGQLWDRPKKMFEETIERDGKRMKRYEFVK